MNGIDEGGWQPEGVDDILIAVGVHPWAPSGEVIVMAPPSTEQARRLEAAAPDRGRQPWRLDPLMVARAAARRALGVRSPHVFALVEDPAFARDDTWAVSHVRDMCIVTHQGVDTEVLVILRPTQTASSDRGVWYADQVVVRPKP